MELFIKKFKKATGKMFGFSFLVAVVVVLFMFSATVFLCVKNVGAFCYVYIGDEYVKKHKFEEAIDFYQRALELYPRHVKARYNLGNIYVAYEDFDSAIECYEKALSYNPNYINARISLGLILAEEKTNPDMAIDEYNKVVQYHPILINIPLIYNNVKNITEGKAIAYYNMGLAYRDKSLMQIQDSMEARDFLNQAADCYRESLKLQPKNYNAQYNLALTYHLLENYTQAIEDYCQAMFIAPLNYESYYNLAVLLRQKGRYSEAMEEFKNAGNLSNLEGDTYKSSFIYGVLGEVSQMAIAQNSSIPETKSEKIENKLEEQYAEIKKEEENAVTPEELEKALVKRLKTSSVCKPYLDKD